MSVNSEHEFSRRDRDGRRVSELYDHGTLGALAPYLNRAEEGDTPQRELGSFGNVIACNADITDRVQLTRLVEESDGKFAKMVLLVNAAGVFVPRPFLEQTMETTTDTLN